GLRLGVITNGPSRTQRGKLAAVGLERYFDLVVVDSEFGQAKPDPRIFAHAAASLGLASLELLFVGDTPEGDVAGAPAAGWRAAWYNPGGLAYPAAILPPHHVLAALAELLTLPGVANDGSSDRRRARRSD